MKAAYEKPIIKKLQTGTMNKFGTNPYYTRKIRRDIDGVPIDDLVKNHGSPLFVFSEKTLRKSYWTIHNAFSTRYPSVAFGWSYKTNYLQAICAVLHRENALAEVVSEFEYEKARKLGVEGRNIIFNGPCKKTAALTRAVTEGAMINVDHFDEIYDLEQLSGSLGRKIKIGIRLNMDTGIYPQWSRFGFNLDMGEAMDVVKRIANGGKLVINGLHCHMGTYIIDTDAYARQVEKMIQFACQIEDHFSFKIEYIDIGGGFPSKSRLKGTYLPPDVAIQPIDEYAEKITGTLYRNLRPRDFPRLIIESGRAVVDESGSLITTICAFKRLPDGTKAYIADAGVNTLFTSFWYKFTIEVDREVEYANEMAVIYGPLCMNIDVIDEGSLLPPLQRGTRLIISPVGAYNVTQWMQFIDYRPAIVLIGEGGEVDVIREAEDLSDIDRREKLPERLKLQ